MKIDDILNLTDGKLQNTPHIKAIESATTFPSKVTLGDLFFAHDNADIASAIDNGAYGIIYEGDVKITDDEIAWIKVDSVRISAFKLLRYVLLSKEADFYLLNPHEMSFFRQITTQKSGITFLSNEWHKAFEQILNSDSYLFVSTDKELLSLIKTPTPILEETAEGYAISDTLFRSTFRVGKYVYQDLKMAPFHLDHLLKVVHLCQKHEIPYSIERIGYTKHFMPLYIDNNLHTVSQGASDKVLIFTDNIEDIVKAREYIRYQTTWVKSIVLTPPKTKVENVDRPYWFESVEQAREILTATHYNYAFVYSLDKDLFKSFEIDKEEYGLF